MAGPLHWFRKNQKLLLGVFGVLLIIAFTFSMGTGIDPIVDYLSGGGRSGGGGQNEVVVSWKDGKLRESDFHNARVRRNMMSAFLTQVRMRALARQAQPRVPALPQLDSDQALLELLILTREAERQGIVVSDDAIVEYLINLSGGTMQSIEFLEIWRDVTGGQGTERQLFDILRRELTAQQMRAMTQMGVYPTSPLSDWDFFNRLERKVDAELLPIPVEDFVGEVTEPSEAEIAAFYEQHKNEYENPNSPAPGFQQREKKAFQYVQFLYDDFFASEQERVTEEDVRAYYEENIEEFRDTSLPETDLEVESSVPADTAAGDPSNADEPGPDSPGSDPPETPSDDMKLDTGATEAATETIMDPAAAGDDGDGRSEEGEEDSAPTDKIVPTDNADAGPDNTTGDESDARTAAAREVDAADAAEIATRVPEQGAQDAEIKGTKSAADEPDSELAVDEAPAADGEARYKPLERVFEEIRDTIARRRAQQRFERAVSKAQSRADRYYADYIAYQLERDRGLDADEPPTPDFTDLDDEFSFVVETVPLSDRFEIQQYDLGKSFQFFERPQGGYGRFEFVEVAYGEQLPLRKARLFPGGPALEKYIFWITETSEARVPELAEIKEKVIDGWKRKQALQLALKAADREAEKARKSGQSLAVACDIENRQISETGPVSWMTAGSVPQAGFVVPRPNEIPGVPLAGQKFYRDLFRLNPGEVAVTTDAPEKTVYVVRVTSATPRLEIRQEEFLQRGGEPYRFYFQKQGETERFRYAWYQDLLEKNGVDWKREPAAGRR